MTYYEVLGVSSEATEREIKVAYRKAVFESHPDKFQGQPGWVKTQAEERTKAINLAYAALKNKPKSEPKVDLYPPCVRCRKNPQYPPFVVCWECDKVEREKHKEEQRHKEKQRQKTAERAAEEQRKQRRRYAALRCACITTIIMLAMTTPYSRSHPVTTIVWGTLSAIVQATLLSFILFPRLRIWVRWELWERFLDYLYARS